MRFTVEAGSGKEVPRPGFYKVKVVEVGEPMKMEFGETISIAFDVNGYQFSELFNVDRITPRSKLAKLWAACHGQDQPTIGAEIDTDDLVGKVFGAHLVNVERRGFTNVKIDAFYRLEDISSLASIS